MPLRSPADIVKVIEAGLLYPRDTRFRARKLLAKLRDCHTQLAAEYELMQPVSRWTSGAELERLCVSSERRWCPALNGQALCTDGEPSPPSPVPQRHPQRSQETRRLHD